MKSLKGNYLNDLEQNKIIDNHKKIFPKPKKKSSIEKFLKYN